MSYWIKLPGPGQFRGEGKWTTTEKCNMPHSVWETYHKNGYLPTRIQETQPEEGEK